MLISALRWFGLALLVMAMPAEAALNAAQGQYAVIAPIFREGSAGLTSFIRLVNNAGEDSGGDEFVATTYTITVVGATTGNTYGVATIPVAAYASPQYSIDEILTAANATPLAGGDTGYALYVTTPHRGTGFMHVVYNGANGFFENVSACQAYVQADTPQKYLFNVHTSALAAYPSQIYVHNYAATAVTYRVTVRDSRTGLTVGTTDLATSANSTTSMSFSQFEQLIGWTPSASQAHVNMEFVAIGLDNSPVLVSTFVTYQSAAVSMSAICQVNDIFDSGSTTTQKFQLSVTKTGAGSVYSSPGGLSCGMDCTYDFNAGATVTLTAQKDTNATFTGWGGACSGTAITCDVVMSAAKSVTATFTGSSGTGGGTSGGGTGTSPFALTVTKAGTGTGSVTSSPVGIDCGALCPNRSFDFNSGVTVTLTAAGASGSSFQGWGGACSGTGLCNVTMDAAKSVTATFAPSANTLTVSIVGTGNAVSTPAGINCGTMGTDCTATFGFGNTVSIQALGQGSTLQNFTGWTGCTSTGGNNGSLCSVVISGSQSVTATFSN